MTRIIPRLDIKGSHLVKGIHLEGLKVLGPPDAYARHYYASGADELLYMDAVASLYGRNNLTELVERTANSIFIPLTVGGGLRSIEDIRDMLRTGADKVAINTAAIERPEFIREAAEEFGTSTIIISIQAQLMEDGDYYAFTDNGRENTHRKVFEWAAQAVELGAGELLVTSINREGTGDGFDLALVRRLAESVLIPVIAAGGAGRLEHIRAVAVDGKADAIGLASCLHFTYARKLVDQGVEFGSHGEFDILTDHQETSRVNTLRIADIKQMLVEANIPCREEAAA